MSSCSKLAKYVTAPLTVSRGYLRVSLGNGKARDTTDQLLEDGIDAVVVVLPLWSWADAMSRFALRTLGADEGAWA